jgi:multidrug resistance efflux pump
MRQRNLRVVIVGFVLIAMAIGFYVFMQSIASTSTDPVALMQTVGTVTGVVTGLSFVIIIFGLIGKKGKSKKA